MKMIFMTYYVALHRELMELIEKHGVCTYTRYPEVEGRLSCGDPRENSHVWPGVNSGLMFAVDDAKVGPILDELAKYNEGSEGEGVDVLVLPVERMITAARS